MVPRPAPHDQGSCAIRCPPSTRRSARSRRKQQRAAAFLLALLFTGFRKTETARLRWTDIDLVQRVITLPAPNTKTKHMTEIPMSDFVYELLVARRALGHNSEFILPSDRAGKPISDTQLPFRKVKEAIGVAVTAHSLRRTYLKVGASARVNVVYLKALANHALAPESNCRIHRART